MNEISHLPSPELQSLSSYLPESGNYSSDTYRQVNELYEQLLLSQGLKQNPQAPVKVLVAAENLEIEIAPFIFNRSDRAVIEFKIILREDEEELVFTVCDAEEHDLSRVFKSDQGVWPDNIVGIYEKSLRITNLEHMDAISLERVELDEKIQIFQRLQQPRDINNVVVPILGQLSRK